MKPGERAAQARRELDRRFRHVDFSTIRQRPRSGWIRAIRVALGMSQESLGRLRGISGEAIAKLEKAELSGGITIAKLAEVAGALDCSVMYALLPNASLEDTVKRQARKVAARQLGYAATTMALEDQGIDAERQAEQLEIRSDAIISRNDQWRIP
ncbi:MAG: mobile mystery protein A [Chloroflexi bacterium]|nr:mobile mystery protein A [Chloroflexota bacterium]